MRNLWLTVWLMFGVAGSVVAGEEGQQVIVADPYVEMHTGPGQGYPITNIIERGDEVGIIKRRTDWYKVSDSRDQTGWVHVSQMAQTLQPSGEPVEIFEPSLDEYRGHRWEFGAMAGDFGGATAYTVAGSRGLSKHLSTEVNVTQILGDFSDGWAANISLVHTFVPEWRVSPFFLLGTGIIEIEPKSTLAQAEDRSDPVGIVGAGIKAYVNQRFLFRAEYRNSFVFTSRNDNEDVDEWRAGFAVFF